MDKIKILREEIKILEQDKSKNQLLKLLNNEKFEFLNDQLEIIKRKIEITNILLEDELSKRFIQNIIGRPPKPNIEKQKSIIEKLLENKESMSPTILGLYGNEIDKVNLEVNLESTSSTEDDFREENSKVNINQYLEMENDSDYENEIIEKLKTLDIKDNDDIYMDVKPNLDPPSVISQGQNSSAGSNMQEFRQENFRHKSNEQEQLNPTRKYIDRRQYYINKPRNHIPMKYVPYDKEPQALNPTGIYLDLDCVENREKMITMWIKENGAVINKEGMTKEQGIEFLRRTMRGSVDRYIESLGEDYETLKTESSTIIIFLSTLEKLIRGEFLGYFSDTTNLWEIDKENAIKGMMNITICNMCYFDQYTCEYTDWFYKARFKEASPEYNFYGKMYYEKLPEPFRSRIIEDFSKKKKELNEDRSPTLGARIWFAKQKINDYCIEAKNQNKIYKYQKRQLCCSKNSEIGRYGCYNNHSQKRKKWKFNKHKFKKYDNKNRYFRRRKSDRIKKSYNDYNRNKAKAYDNPRKTKTCTCFICKQEGHYANQCPKRTKQNIKILDEIYDYGFEPIESDMESDYSIYSASINSEDISDNE